jgi:hypothetical protein
MAFGRLLMVKPEWKREITRAFPLAAFRRPQFRSEFFLNAFHQQLLSSGLFPTLLTLLNSMPQWQSACPEDIEKCCKG